MNTLKEMLQKHRKRVALKIRFRCQAKVFFPLARRQFLLILCCIKRNCRRIYFGKNTELGAKLGFLEVPKSFKCPNRKNFVAPGSLSPISALIVSTVLMGCLNYPAKVSYGKQREPQSEQHGKLISSQFVMELSHKQLEKLDPKGQYQNIRRYPVQVYRIQYRSKIFSPLSALVLLPLGMDIQEYPLLSYQHGTLLPFPYKYLGAYEAPSMFGSRYRRGKKFFAVTRYGLPMASRGYLTIMPDYMGYGAQAGQEHPFMIGPELGQEVIDALRALREWAKEKEIPIRSKLYLAGTSEGAYGAMWAHRLIESAPDFQEYRVNGAYYAGPYHISSMLQDIAFENENIDPLFNWALYSSWDYYLRDAKNRHTFLQGYFKPEEYQDLLNDRTSWRKEDIWKRKVPNLLAILLAKPEPKEKLFHKGFLEELNDRNSYFWRIAKLLSIHNGWKPKGNIYLYHNDKDPLIPVSNSEDALKELDGAVLKKFSSENHADNYLPYLRESLQEFAKTSGLEIDLSEAPPNPKAKQTGKKN